MVENETPEDGHFPEDAEDAAQEIEALRAEVAALKDQALRYAAEAENTRRRAEKEINDARHIRSKLLEGRSTAIL